MNPNNSPLLKTWLKLPKSSKVSIVITSLLLLFAIPLSLQSAMNSVNIFPRASQLDSPLMEGSRQNLIIGQKDTIIECATNTTCLASFSGESLHPDSVLNMSIDFLPAGLEYTQCLPFQDDGQNRLTCGFKGMVEKPGRYKLQVSLTDTKGSEKVSIYTLLVR